MGFLGWYSPNVRAALKKPAALGPDLFVALLLAGILAGTVLMAREFRAPQSFKSPISLSYAALPIYALLSLGRGFAAYILSLLFTLVYGTIAAHNHRAERYMLPLLDILQSIPVLGFLPGVVLALIAVFPNSQMGLELASIIMVFTGQVWNMTFSFHGSLRAIPQQLREVAALQRLSGWETFYILEVPSAMIGLVWNSMMSMAGGWFFLTVTEAFTLGNDEFRLPGLGSFMAEAIAQNDIGAMIAAVVTMIVMIVSVDQLLWRPLVAWSDRFKFSDSSEGEAPQSWALDLLHRSALLRSSQKAKTGLSKLGDRFAGVRQALGQASKFASEAFRVTATPLRWLTMLLLGGFMIWGAFSLLALLFALPLYNDPKGADWLHVLLALLASFARTSAACLLGVAWALPVGIMIGLSPKWSRRLQPVIQVVASFPAPMLFPLVTMAIILLHIPFTAGCVALMLLGTQWYILFNVIAGASAIPNDLKEVARLNQLSTWNTWTQLYLPATFPYLVTGLVTAAGGAWNATIVSEYIKLPSYDEPFSAFGLGSLINIALAETPNANYPLLTACVVTMAACVVTINRVLWKRMYRLAENRFSLNA